MNEQNKNKNTGLAIKQALTYAGLSRNAAARRMDMSLARLHALEKGEGELRFAEAVKLLALTGVTYDEFVAMAMEGQR